MRLARERWYSVVSPDHRVQFSPTSAPYFFSQYIHVYSPVYVCTHKAPLFPLLLLFFWRCHAAVWRSAASGPPQAERHADRGDGRYAAGATFHSRGPATCSRYHQTRTHADTPPDKHTRPHLLVLRSIWVQVSWHQKRRVGFMKIPYKGNPILQLSRYW